MILPEPIQNLISAFERLPGIGPKSASRLVFFLLRAPEDASANLADALLKLKSQTDFCPECFNIMLAGRERCEICASSARDEFHSVRGRRAAGCDRPGTDWGLSGKYHVLAWCSFPDRRDRS